MKPGETIQLCWSDYVGITRCRGVPAARYSSLTHGLGWAAAGQALLPWLDIADNPWGPMTEVRQVPAEETRTRLDLWPDRAPFHVVLCNSMVPAAEAPGGLEPWGCCTRSFMDRHLAAFEAETGCRFIAAFEHEFTLELPGLTRTTAFSLESMRQIEGFSALVTEALIAAGCEPETVEPEYGLCQFEVATAPAAGSMAGDRAILTREVIRECARGAGGRACFSPKPMPGSVGNGAHVHFSFLDAAGNNAAHDPERPGGASRLAEGFIAGLVRHMPALTALLGPSPVSYLRLVAHSWSCGYASFGIQNREAAVRICPSTAADPERRRRGWNMEARVPDATASPYMVIGALVAAGLDGIRRGWPLPPAIECDPSDLTEAERAAAGITRLPETLEQALAVLQADPVVSGFMDPLMLSSYAAVKRKEAESFRHKTLDQLCEAYRHAY